jgi:hypothetical protein
MSHKPVHGYSSGYLASGPAPPPAITGADWQAGVTPNSDGFRPMLNGKPIAGAFAASVREGWVCVAEELLPRMGIVTLLEVPEGCR